MLKTFYRWRMRRCASYAIKTMSVGDYKGALHWLRIAKRWERLAAR
jgi:hypothetical protein